MNIMKKIIIYFLAVLLMLSFASCGDSPVPSGNENNNEVNSNEPFENDSGNTSSIKDVTIEEQVILDENDVKITVTSFDNNAFMGPELKVLIENNSASNLTIQTRNSSINGIMADTIFSCDVAAGKKANDSIIFTITDYIEEYTNIIADLEFSFHIFDSESWETYYDSDKIALETSASNSFDYSYDNSGEIIYDNNGIKVIFKGLSNDFFGPGFILYVENNSGKSVTVQTRDVSVNGFMIEPAYSADVNNNKISIDSASFFSSDFDENGITEINELEFSLHIFDTDSWNTIDDSDAILLTF